MRYLEHPCFRHIAACVPLRSNGTLLTVRVVLGVNSVIADIAMDFVVDDVPERRCKEVRGFEEEQVLLKSVIPHRHPDPPQRPYELVFEFGALRFFSAQAVTVLHRHGGNQPFNVRTKLTLSRWK